MLTNKKENNQYHWNDPNLCKVKSTEQNCRIIFLKTSDTQYTDTDKIIKEHTTADDTEQQIFLSQSFKTKLTLKSKYSYSLTKLKAKTRPNKSKQLWDPLIKPAIHNNWTQGSAKIVI